MMLPTRSASITFINRRSVESNVPTSEPVEEICSANSTNRRSTTLAETVPRFAMICEISLISSSLIRANILEACSSPSDISRMAAFSGPDSDR